MLPSSLPPEVCVEYKTKRFTLLLRSQEVLIGSWRGGQDDFCIIKEHKAHNTR